MAPGEPSVSALLGALEVGVGLGAVVAAVLLHRRAGWSISEAGISPSPRAARLGELALAGAVLAAGLPGLLQGVGTVLVDPPVSVLFEDGPAVAQLAAVALALASLVAFLGGVGWRLVAERDA